MNKLTTLFTLLALTLTMSAVAQPDEGPRDRPDRGDRAEQRERGDRSGDRERARPGEREGKGKGSGQREPLTADQVDEALATLREMHGDKLPQWMQRVEQQAEEDPEKAAKSLSRFPRIREMMEARKSRPAEFALQSRQGQLMREVLPMVRDVRRAQANNDQAKVDELTPRIREKIENLFQVRLELKEFEIKRMREKLAKAEKELTEIQADSESLVNEKMQDIMSGKGPLGPRDKADGERGDRGDGPRDGRPPKPERDERDE